VGQGEKKEKGGDAKGNKSQKKKAVKKVGTAAVVGVAGKKVTSTIELDGKITHKFFFRL